MAEVEVDEMLRFCLWSADCFHFVFVVLVLTVCHKAAKIPADNAVPCCSFALVELVQVVSHAECEDSLVLDILLVLCVGRCPVILLGWWDMFGGDGGGPSQCCISPLLLELSIVRANIHLFLSFPYQHRLLPVACLRSC